MNYYSSLNTTIYVDEIKIVVNTRTVVQEAERYNTKAVIFWHENGNKHIIWPPFPIPENKAPLGEPTPSPLCKAMEREYVVGIILVTQGSYSLGIFQGDDLVEYKAGKGVYS
jgi:hypothetical protein